MISYDAIDVAVFGAGRIGRIHAGNLARHPGARPFQTVTLHGEPQVLWPDHCVAGSPGAALAPGVPWERVRAIVRKGTDPEVDSYSGFRNNWDRNHERPPTGLAGYLRECGIAAVYVCGLARDYCVHWSALDAAAEGFTTTVLWDLTRPVDPASDATVRGALERAGVTVIDSSELG